MSTEVRKRGRPKKVIEEVVVPLAEKSPNPETSKTTKSSSKSSAITTKADKKSNGASAAVKGKKKSSEGNQEPGKRAKTVKVAPKTEAEETSPPSAVARAIAVEESRILKEISQTEDKNKRTSLKQEERPVIGPSLAAVTPSLKQEEPPSTASHLQPTNTLAMGFPIPTHQSTSQTLGLQPVCLPWLPNPPTLQQAAYLSTTTPMQAANKRKLPSLKEVNRFVVSEQSSRQGSGSGAAQSRAQKAAEEARGGRAELLRPGELPAKYKPAARRVQAIIVALPIVFVTSYMLYERLVLGVEPKQLPRVPSGAAGALPPPSNSGDESATNSD